MNTTICVFGGLSVTHANTPITIKGAKHQALLGWLALHANRPSHREQIAALLWPDADPQNARISLRQAVASLRRVLPEDSLLSQSTTLQLNPQTVWIDAMAFTALATSGYEDQRHEAAALYQGELLKGVGLQLDTYTDWLVTERERFRRQALALLTAQREQARENADTPTEISVCELLTAIDPLREEIHQDLIRLYADSGQMGDALRQYELCKEALARELSTPPSPATVALMQSIRSGQYRAPLPKLDDTKTNAEVHERSTHKQSIAPAPHTDRQPKLPSIAVLPFMSMSSDPEHEYLADGMTEELINLLANCVNWRVTARNSSFKYKGQHVDVREVGKTLGVDYIVEGSVRRVSTRIRVTAQLVSTKDGTHVWSDRYDRDLSEIFDVQDEVIHAIFRTLKNRIGFAERERIRRTQKADLDAWGLLVKASQIRVRDAATRDEQRQLALEALSIDPDYARAHGFLATVMFLSVARGYTGDAVKDFTAAKRHADRALQTGDTDPVVLKACAAGYAAVGQSREAMRLAHRAFEISGTVDTLYVAALMWNGRLEQADEHCHTLVDQLAAGVPSPPSELRPVALLGNLKMLQGDIEAAHNYAERDLFENPGNYFSHVNLANILGLLGRHEEACHAWQYACELMPGLNLKIFETGYAAVFADEALAHKFSAGLNAAGVPALEESRTA